MFNTIKSKIYAVSGTSLALLSVVAVSAHAAALDAMTATSTPMDFVTASISDAKGFLLPILGVTFLFYLLVMAIKYGFRKVKSIGGRG